MPRDHESDCRHELAGRPGPAFNPGPSFRSPWWLRSPHLQTIAGKAIRRNPGITLRRERIETPDGDFLDLDLASSALRPPTDLAGPIVLVMHGLEGSTRSPYMITTYHQLLGAGFQPIGLNFRSCSGEPNRLARFYHSGETDDLRHVLDYLADRSGAPIHAVIGYSLGGNVLLKFLGEEGDDATRRLGRAVAVSVPLDLAEGARALEKGVMGRVYSEYFLRSLRTKIMAKGHLIPDRIDTAAALRARTLRGFDDLVTAPLHGFDSADQYYRLSSSRHFLRSIRCPTLVIQATDDPFQPVDSLPLPDLRSNPWITPVISRSGGHLGFINGSIHNPELYAESLAVRFLTA